LTENQVKRWATGLGWFSIGLGLGEMFWPDTLARVLGVRSARLVRAFGAREMVAGIGLLTQRRKGPWIGARVAGDALDFGVLMAAAARGSSRVQRNVALATAAVAPVIAADVLVWRSAGERVSPGTSASDSALPSAPSSRSRLAGPPEPRIDLASGQA